MPANETVSNLFKCRGRLARDPFYAESKSNPAEKYVFCTIVLETPYKTVHGEDKTRRQYIDIKGFDGDLSKKMETGNLSKGALIAVTGTADAALDEYTDSETGEPRSSCKLQCIVRDADGIQIIALPQHTEAAA